MRENWFVNALNEAMNPVVKSQTLVFLYPPSLKTATEQYFDVKLESKDEIKKGVRFIQSVVIGR